MAESQNPPGCDLWFVPEHVTQLYYTPEFRQLSQEQRLRYNQLYAAHINEQFAYFERQIGNPISERVLARLDGDGQEQLTRRIDGMIDDEERHQRLFCVLNRETFPELYAEREYHFIRISYMERALLAGLVAASGHLPCLIWLAMFFEEFSLYLSNEVVCAAQRGERLEPQFVAIHMEHVRDETRHVRLYPDILRAVLKTCSARSRRLQGWMLKLVMREILAPKRSGVAVVVELVKQRPELAAMRTTLIRSVRELRHSSTFFDALFGPRQLPQMHRMFGEFPEFAWHGYSG